MPKSRSSIHPSQAMCAQLDFGYGFSERKRDGWEHDYLLNPVCLGLPC